MSLLNKTIFDTTYANPSGQFITNPDGLIEADRLRAFAKDVNESTPVIGVTTIAGLKAIGTTNLSAGMVAIFREDSSQRGRIYQLKTGTIAEASPITLRPNDYAVSTNEKYWQLAASNGSYEKSSTPTVSDDSAAGYAIGDMWIHTTPYVRQIYFCVNNATGAAVWLQVHTGDLFVQTVNVTTASQSLAIDPLTDVVVVNLRTPWTTPTITGWINRKIVTFQFVQDYTGAGSTPAYPFQFTAPANLITNDGVGITLKSRWDGVFDEIAVRGVSSTKGQQLGGVSYGTASQV